MYIVKKEALRRKREENMLSQCRLSTLAGLPCNAIFRMETKDYKVSPIRAWAVSRALKCDIFELFEPL